MATFTGQLISATYDAILKTVDNDPIGAAAKQITDGLGNVTPLYISTTQIGIGITPTEVLHVSGNIKATGTLTIDSDATIDGNISFDSLTGIGVAVTINKFVSQADGIASNDNDTTLPTSAAVKDYVDTGNVGQVTGSGIGGKLPIWTGVGASTALSDSAITEESTRFVLTKDIFINEGIPTLTLSDSNSAGSATLGDIIWQDSTASQRAILSLNTDILAITSKQGGITLGTNSTTALTIDGSQNATFASDLTVSSELVLGGAIDQNGTANNSFTGNLSINNATNPYVSITDSTNSSNITLQALDSSTKLDFNTALNFEYGNSIVQRIESTGVIITGTLRVSDTLIVNKAATAAVEIAQFKVDGTGGTSGNLSYVSILPGSDNFATQLRLHTNNTGNNYQSISNISGGLELATNDGNPMYFKTDSVTRLTISNTGNATFTGTISGVGILSDGSTAVTQSAADASTKVATTAYADAAATAVPIGDYLPLAGGTLTGNLGIGGSPNVRLGLSNSTALTAVYQQFTNGTTGTAASDGTVMGIDSDGDFLINNQEAKEIKLYTSDSLRLTIDSSGNSTFAKAVNIAGTLTLDQGSLLNGIINTPASLRINIDSNDNNTGEVFVVGHNQTNIDNNNVLFKVEENGNSTFSGNILFGTDGTYDIGSTAGSRPRNVVVSNSIAINTSTGAAGTLNAGGTGTFVDAVIINGSYPGITINSTSYTRFSITNRFSSNYVTFDMTPQGGSTLEAVTITNTGNLGIGIAPTNGKLEVQQTATDAALWVQTGGTTSSYTIADFRTGSNLSALAIKGDGNSIFAGNLDSIDGKGYRLKNAANSGNEGGFLRSGLWEGNSDRDPALFAETGLSLKFYTGGSADERMRITSGGAIQIGYIGTLNGFGAENVSGVYYSGGASGGYAAINSNSSNAPLYISRGSGQATGIAINFASNGSGVGNISITGSTTSYNTSSDYRLKENVVGMTGALDRVSQLKPSRFNFIADADKTVDGFLAHQVQEIVPEAITGEKDAMQDEEYEVSAAIYEDVIHPAIEEELDEDGNITTEAKEEWTESVLVSEAVKDTRQVPNYQGIDQSKLVPLLVAAIQELKAEVDLLKSSCNCK